VIDDEVKYRVEIFKIFGLIFLTPGGRLLFDILYLEKYYEPLKLMMLIFMSFILAIIGMILINRGRELLV